MNNLKACKYFKSIPDWATIERHGYNDFSIYWHNGDCSSRGRLEELVEEMSKDTEGDFKSLLEAFVLVMDEEERYAIAGQLWNELEEEIEYDDYNRIKEDFYWWCEGTDRFEIWGDLEDLFGVNVEKDFMRINPDEQFIKITEDNNMISTPKTSCGRYMNIWSDNGEYNCYIHFHECEDNDKIDKAIKETEGICHHIMQYKHMPTNEKRKLIEDLLDTYVEFGIGVNIITDKTRERSEN